MAVQSARKPLASDLQRRNTDQNQAGLGQMALSDLQSMAREEGEGMETTETESSPPALTPLPSLEHLLASPDPKQGMFERKVKLRRGVQILLNNNTLNLSIFFQLQDNRCGFKTTECIS